MGENILGVTKLVNLLLGKPAAALLAAAGRTWKTWTSPGPMRTLSAKRSAPPL